MVEGDEFDHFVVEIWLEEWDTSHPLASAEGWGSVSLSEDDFPFDDGWFWESDWDTWYVTVTPGLGYWDELVCEDSTYAITIES